MKECQGDKLVLYCEWDGTIWHRH